MLGLYLVDVLQVDIGTILKFDMLKIECFSCDVEGVKYLLQYPQYKISELFFIFN